MKKAFRITQAVTDTKENADKTAVLLGSYKDYIDEAAIFESFSHHGFWGIKATEERAAQLKYAIKSIKAAGISSVGINVLCTIGHLDEGWEYLDKPDIGTVMGKNGEYSKSCLCVNAPGYTDYIRERYRLFAEAGPDFIWVDDDFRYGNHKFSDVCYCPHCIKKYNELNKSSYTRSELVKVTEEDPNELNKWTAFKIKGLSEISEVIKDAIYKVNNNIEIGLMTCPESEREWAVLLDCKKLRPGGGFYNDEQPAGAFVKGLYTAMQNLKFKGITDDVQYEFENFPYQENDKSDTIRSLECAIALSFGCSGIAFNALGGQNDMGIMRTVKKEAAYWDSLTGHMKDKDYAGIYCEASDMNETISLLYNIARIGLPVCPERATAAAGIYTGKAIAKKSDAEILKILSGSALFDTEALEEIQRRGFAEYCGCRTGEYYSNGMTERITGSEINGESAGFNINAYMNFWPQVPKICGLIPDDKANILSRLETITGITGDPCMTAYENNLGGRIVVSSYFFVTYSKFIKKRAQLINIFRWLTNDCMPIELPDPTRVVPIIRKDGRETAAVLANLDFDPVENLKIRINGEAGKNLYVLNGGEEIFCGKINSDSTAEINSIPPWDEITVIVK